MQPQTSAPSQSKLKPLLYQDVVASVFEALIEGRILPGDRLVEQHIAAELGVSRSPVRQALQEMARQGIVTLIPQVGARVTTWSTTDVRDFGLLRSLTEGLAAEQAAQRGSPADLDQIARAIKALEKAIEGKRLSETMEMDIAFHQAIVDASGNASLRMAFEGMKLRIRMFMIIQKSLYPSLDGQREALSHHQRIYEALQAQAAGRARELMAHHILHATENLVGRMNRRNGESRPSEVLPIVESIVYGPSHRRRFRRAGLTREPISRR